MLCDEVIDVACKQQVSIVLRFVDSDCNIQEEFLDFIKVERITGEVLAREIKNVLASMGLTCKTVGDKGMTALRICQLPMEFRAVFQLRILKQFMYIVILTY